MTEWSVPVRSSGWRGTGTVTVPRSRPLLHDHVAAALAGLGEGRGGEDGADLPPREPTQPPQR